MYKKILNRFLLAWVREEPPPFLRFLRSLLFPLSVANSLIQQSRATLYRIGIFPRRKLGLRVISVGNLSMGGSGKTPATALIARLLEKKGMKPAILSRGYGGGRKKKTPLVASDGQYLLADEKTAGDEPYLLAKILKTVPVIVGADRTASGRMAKERFSCNTVILDDGFQHLCLEREINMCLIDCQGKNIFKDMVFPSGFLREPVSQLKRADVFLLTRWEGSPRDQEVMQKLKERFNKPTFRAHHVPTAWIEVVSSKEFDLSALAGKKILAFCGIANPHSFLHTLRNLGTEPVAFLPFPDHHRYSPQDLQDIKSQGERQGAQIYVTTEKDSVKLTEGLPFSLWALRIEMAVLEEGEFSTLFDFTDQNPL